MRIHAYLLAGDPRYAASSLRSYYSFVEKVVVSYDQEGLSWAGHEMDPEPVLSSLRRADTDSKVEYLKGSFSHPEQPALECETRQRQATLDRASQGADWVLQLDTDEILLDPAELLDCIRDADRFGAVAVEYPARWLYASTRSGRYLEASRRFWGPAASFPGPVVVRAGTRLTHCRQCEGATYRVDWRSWNSDPWRPRDASVHRRIRTDQSIAHYAWARDEDEMRLKARLSGHAEHLDWDRALSRWVWRRRHPWLTALGTPCRRRGHQQWLRIAGRPRTGI